jgi:hypothetical protein
MMTLHEPENARGYQSDCEELHFMFCTHHGDTNLANTSTTYSNIPGSWILLDNQSTIDVFINAKLLKNIRATNT